MPDWSYQSLFRPLLFRLPARLARSLTLSAMGAVARMPGGALVIRTLGHMEPAELLHTRLCEVEMPTPVGLSGTVDPQGRAVRALAQLGFGFVEVGPITVTPVADSAAPIEHDPAEEVITYPAAHANAGLAAISARMAAPGHRLVQWARIATLQGSSQEEAVSQLLVLAQTLAPYAAGFYVDVVDEAVEAQQVVALLGKLSEQLAGKLSEQLSGELSGELSEQLSGELSGELSEQLSGKLSEQLAASGADGEKPLLLYLPVSTSAAYREQLLAALAGQGWPGIAGIVIGEARLAGGESRLAPDDKAAAITHLQAIGACAPPHFALKAAVGSYEPQDALELQDAGAVAVLLHGGLVSAGPGLPKRINEAILYQRLQQTPAPAPASFWQNWGWMCLLGLGMCIGGLLTWIVALTSVLLPYDFAFLGMTRAQLEQANPHLLHFMSHDRVTLAGTMVSIGILYFMLGRYGLREGLHWARTALFLSGAVGFSSFLLYLGYGYFDPLHAGVAALLLPLFLLSMRNNPDQPYRKPVNLRNDRAWQLAMRGQLCMVVLGFSLAIGGLVIAGVGVTVVFVPEDLAYLGVTAEQLNAIDPQLVPLIAHDRAGFGGALFSNALALLVMALWGLQQGARWMWFTFLLGGAPAFFGALSIHAHIGYTDLWHLAPALFALALYIVGLVLLYPYLMHKGEDQHVRLSGSVA